MLAPATRAEHDSEEQRVSEQSRHLDARPRGGAESPWYVPVGDEVKTFEAAWRRGLPVMLKGPTGCGKTRLVEFIADRAGVPLFTVSCHEDMTASDLLGRYILVGNDTEWVD